MTDLLATLQELKHLGDGFVSLTEALDLTTRDGRAMAGLLAIFAEFEREVRQERTRAGLEQARQKANGWADRKRRRGVHSGPIRFMQPKAGDPGAVRRRPTAC